ncbi:cytochrome c-type biogenesis protein [Emcibacter nanhaiensis]|uniref:Cytochrome c-type biogenesis protein n=1 Tax=Emcibacter nanhaiensis TaxID=1505037 RepID=A0A501PM49_9PROT|nr:cytochrome c-type biogenesis protein [Emcibacter nanhaiensis]TPD61579.1 cytochrome c-type biogenesis protein CcmH [Emcibacter nanhaiensis]
MRAVVLSVLLIFFTQSAFALGVDDGRLKDPIQEARAQELMKQLRCLVCQNQSIVDSNADLAQDLRMVVRERILAGDTDEEVLHYMTDRYGDWVLLKPPLKSETMMLWFSPLILLVIGAIFAVLYLRRRSSAVQPAAPLSHEEEARLEKLLHDGEEK